MSDLDARSIERELRRIGARIGAPCTVVEATGSTNDDAKRAASAGAPSGASFLADEQTAGRGRMGHSWHSPAGDNLYMSVIVRPNVDITALPRVTLVVGLAVAQTLEPLVAGAGLSIKWPNDVYAGPMKLAGVLVEASFRGGDLGALIVGVGVNVHAQGFPADIAARATSLHLLGAQTISRGAIAARLLHAFGEAIAAFETDGLAPSLPELRARDALFGCAVEVGSRRGVAAGIDDEGRLLVRTDAVVSPVSAGEPLLVGTALRSLAKPA